MANNILLLEDDMSLIDGLQYSLKRTVMLLRLPILYQKQKDCCRTSTNMIC